MCGPITGDLSAQRPLPDTHYTTLKRALSSRTKLVATSGLKRMQVAAESLCDRLAQLRSGGEAADRHLVVLDLLEDRLDLVQFGAVGRQVVQVDAELRQAGPRRLDQLADVQAGVVQHHHSRHVRRRQ